MPEIEAGYGCFTVKIDIFIIKCDSEPVHKAGKNLGGHGTSADPFDTFRRTKVLQRPEQRLLTSIVITSNFCNK